MAWRTQVDANHLMHICSPVPYKLCNPILDIYEQSFLISFAWRFFLVLLSSFLPCVKSTHLSNSKERCNFNSSFTIKCYRSLNNVSTNRTIVAGHARYQTKVESQSVSTSKETFSMTSVGLCWVEVFPIGSAVRVELAQIQFHDVPPRISSILLPLRF